MNYWTIGAAVMLHLWILGPVTWLTAEAKAQLQEPTAAGLQHI